MTFTEILTGFYCAFFDESAWTVDIDLQVPVAELNSGLI